jgi:hypothetical protein
MRFFYIRPPVIAGDTATVEVILYRQFSPATKHGMEVSTRRLVFARDGVSWVFAHEGAYSTS